MNKKFEEFIEKLKTGEIYTHGGTFHADDVMSVAVINQVCDKYGLPRPRVNRISDLEQAKELAKDNIVFDIGLGEYDHHQKDNEVRENGVPYAALGKIWRTVGEFLVGENVAKRMDNNFIQVFDKADNGLEPNTLSTVISMSNPNWDSDETPDEAFAKAVDLASTILVTTIESELSKERAETIIRNAVDKMKDGVIVLEKFVPWLDYVQNNVPDANFVVFPSNRGGYNVQTVPEPGERQGKILFPDKWLGMPVKSLGMTFCHPGNFLASFETQEQAVAAAKIATDEYVSSRSKTNDNVAKRKTVVAVLSVDENLLEDGRFSSEMGWVEESGIFLRDYTEETNSVTVVYANGEHTITTV